MFYVAGYEDEDHVEWDGEKHFLCVQRVSQYDKYINELYTRTPARHSDVDTLHEAASTVKNMVKDREDEVGQAENENKLQQVQDRFPNDDLLLTERELPKEKFKARAARRQSAPTTVLRSAFSSNKTKSNEKLSGLPTSLSFTDQQSLASMEGQHIGGSSGRLSPTSTSSSSSSWTNNNNRQYIMEAPVQSTVGAQSQCRYLFLFNDMLVIAKPNKSGSNFRLKHRLRVSELWLATCIEDVCEVSKPVDCSFVLGWPTTNCVLTFSSLEERNLWWHCLEKHIDAQRDKEELKSLSVRVINKETKSTTQAEQTQVTMQVGITDTAKKLLELCKKKFSLESTVEDNTDYQLWVRSSKETGMYPLLGHELPYAIKMSHLRDVLAKYDDLLYPEDEDQVLSFAEKELPEHKCQFILRKAGKTNSSNAISIDTSGVQKKFRKGKKSPFKLSFKRSLSTSSAKSPDGSNSPVGKLFGIALPILCPDNSLPKSIHDLITTLYNNGPFFSGVFRKSANARVCREVRAKFDAGEHVDVEELTVPAMAALFKEFMRSLPDSVFACDLYEEWMASNDIEDVLQRIDCIKSLLDKVPATYLMMLHHIFCMLHYIDHHNDENNMNAHNLAICVAPSLIWPPLSSGALAQAQAVKKAPALVKFMIEHCIKIFGDDITKVFGDAPIRKDSVRQHHDSSGDSDSMHSGHTLSGLKRDDSSLESIERELYDNDLSPSPRTIHWPGQLLSPSTLSRDSGLTSSNNDLYPESEASDTTDSGVESKKETSGSNSSMGSQTGLRHSRSAGYVQHATDLGYHDNRLSPNVSGRRGSEPQAMPVSSMRPKKIVVRGTRSTGITRENSPDTSDNEVEISPETMQMLKGLNRESSLFSELIENEYSTMGQVSARRPASQNATVVHGHSQGMVSPSEETPDLQTRPKHAHMMSNNSSSRQPKWHSPSSSSSSAEGLFPAQAMMPRSKPAQHEPVRRQTSNSKLQRSVPVLDRPKTLAINRPSHHSAHYGAPSTSKQMHPTPPREFFPRDATQTSLQQNPRSKGVLKSQSDTHLMERRQRPWDTEHRLSPVPDNAPKQQAPPTYQEAMNRRAMFHRNVSVDSAGLRINPAKSQWQRSRQPVREKRSDGSQSSSRASRPALRTVQSVDSGNKIFYDDKSHRMESGGIIYLSSDSESSDEDTVGVENLKLYSSHPSNGLRQLKPPSVRRTSSDRTESRDNRVSDLAHAQDNLQRSSSERRSPLVSPTTGPVILTQEATPKSQTPEKGNVNNRTLLSPNDPPLSRRHESPIRDSSNVAVVPPRQILRRSVSNEDPKDHGKVGRTVSNNSTTSADSGISPRTALHFPFPDPHAEPPKSPATQARSGDGDRVCELNKDEELKQKILQARRNWQKKRQTSSVDSGACVDDLDSIEFTEESYV